MRRQTGLPAHARAGTCWQSDQFISRLAQRIGYGLGGGSPKDIANSDALERQPSTPSPGRIFPSMLEGPGARDYDSPDTAVFDHSNHQMPYHEGDVHAEGAPIGHRDVRPENMPMREVGDIEIDADYGNDLKDLVEGRMDAPLNDASRRAPRHEAQRQPWVAVDLDGTILEQVRDPEPEVGDIDLEQPSGSEADTRQIPLGQPKPGAAEALVELARLGWRISIYTARFGDEGLTDEVVARWAQEIAEHLKTCGVPFSDIWVGRKPRADYFVDDKAIHFDGDWDAVLSSLTMVPSPPRGSGETVTRGDDRDGSGGPLDYVESENEFADPLERGSRGVDRPPELEGILTARVRGSW